MAANRPIGNPLAQTDLLRLTDSVIFGEQLQKLAPAELKEARGSQTYKMLQRVGLAMYRAGEQGLRPKPALMAVDKGHAEQIEPTPTEA